MELFFLSCFPSDISLLSQWRMGQWRDGNKATKMCPRYYQCSIWRTLLLSSLYFSFLDFHLIGRILKPVYCSVHSRRGGSMTWHDACSLLQSPSSSLAKYKIQVEEIQLSWKFSHSLDSDLDYISTQAHWRIKLRVFTTQEEATKNMKPNSSQWDTEIKGNDRLKLQQRKFWLYLRKNGPPEYWNCCP